MVIVTDIEQLRRPTSFVNPGTDISEIVANLFRELKEFRAFALAANQLGYTLRIFVMTMNPSPPICIVNPRIVKVRGSQIKEEHCLSLPGIVRKVKRPKTVTIKGLNQYYKPVRYRLNGMQAAIACHEVDHLIGKLIIDY